MCKSVSSSSVHGTDMSLHRRLDEQTVLVTGVIVVVNKEQFLLRTVPSFMLLLPFSHFSHHMRLSSKEQKNLQKNKPYKGFSRFRTDLNLVGLTCALYVLFLIMIMLHGHPFCYAAD